VGGGIQKGTNVVGILFIRIKNAESSVQDVTSLQHLGPSREALSVKLASKDTSTVVPGHEVRLLWEL
jgi:hypothetical protein